MKIILCVVLAFCAILSLAGCGNNADTGKKTTATQTNVKQSEKTTENEDVGLLNGTYNVPLEDIYIDAPRYNMINEGYTQVFLDNDKKYFAFTCMNDDTATDEKDAFDKTFPFFQNNISDEQDVNSLKDVTNEEVVVNSIPTIRTKGTISAGRHPVYDAFYYGYSFVFNGYPCLVCGAVIDESQPQSEIDEIIETVDAMMKTVRDHE